MPSQPMHARSVNMQDIYVNIGSLRSTVLDFGQLSLNPGRSCPGCVRCRFLCKKDEHRNSLIFGQNATLLASIAACLWMPRYHENSMDFFVQLLKCDCNPASLRVFPSRLTVPLWPQALKSPGHLTGLLIPINLSWGHIGLPDVWGL